ncbi:MAG: rubredoxin [Clostridia bacterium]|nr:rubredoxin [Clostridia bacterium]
MSQYFCLVCQYVYDPRLGDPVGGIPDGTPFERLPSNWICPRCAYGKEMFQRIQDLW